MANSKLGRPTKERLALVRNQVSSLLWNGYLETTLVKAKSVKATAEKQLTLAINTYKDVVKVSKTKIENGKEISVEVLNDGPKKLAARRKLMGFLYDLQEQRKPKEAKADFIARTEDSASILDILPKNYVVRIILMAFIMACLFFVMYIPWLVKDIKSKKQSKLLVSTTNTTIPNNNSVRDTKDLIELQSANVTNKNNSKTSKSKIKKSTKNTKDN